MQIAVDARFFSDAIDGYGNFAREIMLKLAKQQAEHQFIFFSDKPIDALPGNVTPVIITPKPTHFFLYKWWYDVKVPLALKKHKADVFICPYGLSSLTASIPQVLMVPDLTFLHHPAFFPKKNLSFYEKFTSGFLKKAEVIAVFSDFLKKEIIEVYAIPAEKVTVIDIAADVSFKPLHWEEREKVKEQYAQGCEYFAFTGGFNPGKNLMNLLKAFSIFKKWQKTNMKLLIAINSSEYKDQSEKLNTYKYRNEICFAENLSIDELARVTGGAYAMIFPSFYEGYAAGVLEAMQCEVPVITSPGSSMAETAGDAALYAGTDNPQEMAEQMKLIFKDEQLRNKLAAAGKEKAKQHNPDKTLALTWQLIQQAVSK